MIEILLAGVIALLGVVVVLQIIQLCRKATVNLTPLEVASEKVGERIDKSVRDEFARNRDEAGRSAHQLSEGQQNAFRRIGEYLVSQFGAIQTNLNQRLDAVRGTIEERLGVIQKESTAKLDLMRTESATSVQKMREEVALALKSSNELTEKTIKDFLDWQRTQFGGVTSQLKEIAESNDKRLVEVRDVVEGKLKSIQEDNNKNLEQMRLTVDEKLQGTLEKRLGESFKLVSERLEQVHKGLGEMQSLAVGVGDLKRVLTNVKARGTWGEVQLERMLEQIFTTNDYEKNIALKDGAERVEFAIRLPGRGDDRDEIVWLPIDSKFPIEDYQRLQDAQEANNADLIETFGKQLENRIKGCAFDICDKYLNPPKTTDFGILFLPTEGLFSEAVRRPGLCESLQRDHKVIVAGPTTLWAILNSLQMGFRTLAIQQRSSEVWNLLGAVKAEFGKYGSVLEKVQKKLQEASNTIDTAAVRTRAIERKLRDVQELPSAEAEELLTIEGIETNEDEIGVE